MGPLRWDHQNSDEFEATFQAHWGDSHWGDESDLKFARLLATGGAGFLRLVRAIIADHLGLSKNDADSLTSTYRSKYKILETEILKVMFDLPAREEEMTKPNGLLVLLS